jgi:hypothetical protein
MTGLFERYREAFKAAQEDELTLNDHLALCKSNLPACAYHTNACSAIMSRR